MYLKCLAHLSGATYQIQLTLEDEFEFHEYAYIWIFVNKYTVSPPYPCRFNQMWIKYSIFSL